MTDNLTIAAHVLARRMLTLLSVDKTFLLRYGNFSSNFRSLLLDMGMASLCLKHMDSVLFAFT